MHALSALRRLRGPSGRGPVHRRAWLAGFRDGFSQPHDLSTTRSVWSLKGALEGFEADLFEDYELQESLDRGACAGQFLRAPLSCQRWWA